MSSASCLCTHLAALCCGVLRLEVIPVLLRTGSFGLLWLQSPCVLALGQTALPREGAQGKPPPQSPDCPLMASEQLWLGTRCPWKARPSLQVAQGMNAMAHWVLCPGGRETQLTASLVDLTSLLSLWVREEGRTVFPRGLKEEL